MVTHEERLVRLVAERPNRTILTILEGAGSLSLDELADRLVGHDATVMRSADFERERDRARLSLHHDRLPRLAAAGLLEYDADEHVVSARSDPADAAEWLDVRAIDELLSRFGTGTAADRDSIGVLEGRDDVDEYARRLAAEAEEELFLVYTDEGLLDADCLPYAERAIEHGVDFHAGATNDDVRAYFHDHLPGATVWEPAAEWMRGPTSYPTVSRLVFADRERLVLGLWNESGGDGERTETAMIGEGRTNPLVVLARELLGPRLDHLDYQSEDFLSDLPFET